METIVVGSGPVGSFAALKLLEDGHNVLMVDIGDKVSKMSNNIKVDLMAQQVEKPSIEKLWRLRLSTLK